MNAVATFIGPKVNGFVSFTSKNNKTLVHIHIHITNCKSIAHAIHIHEFGDMRGGCDTLGAHYNPYKKDHGSIWVNENERHAGDLINNIYPDLDGDFDFEYIDNLLTISDILGRSVVIHVGEDDLGLGGTKESKTTGSAGKRLACAIIGIQKK